MILILVLTGEVSEGASHRAELLPPPPQPVECLSSRHWWEREEGWAVGVHTGSGRGLQGRKTKAFRDSSKELLCERGNLGGVTGFTLPGEG